jgi:hypothetical protein
MVASHVNVGMKIVLRAAKLLDDGVIDGLNYVARNSI